ncbi:MFS transporter [Horticoccus luteus]|uniref:MFS transporter n=1 Tax=Horticoccus luteus TaxID=2862869 RepID=A0A8F9XM64_9BACT|nr:MFS transporter [Horticoccus luteus]QYM79931.1 MFS transporter [Horticoccus luteus]
MKSPERPLSLGVIFLTIFIDLLGFTIIFPLFPAILEHYLRADGSGGGLGWLLAQIDHFARLAGSHSNYREVLFGGVLGSLYAFLQFLFAPLWGTLSDRIGRRRVLLMTVAGTTLSYVLWFFSGSFLLFIVARLIGGAFAGNLSVATAAVADVTTRENRAKGMGIIGVAFGLGFLFGPAIGSLAAFHDFTLHHPGLTRFGVNPFSFAALLAFAFSLVNLVWVAVRFRETLDPAHSGENERVRIRHPLHELLHAKAGPARRTNWLYFIFTLAFSGMEFSLPFLAKDRFAYEPTDMFKIFVFLGLVLIFTQGGLVRRAVPRFGEKPVLLTGLLCVCLGIALVGLSRGAALLYTGLGAIGVGAGLINPSVSSLVSLYSPPAQQGRTLGVFRSLGSLARGIGPVVACLFYWWQGATVTYLLAAAIVLAPWFLALPLPRPQK